MLLPAAAGAEPGRCRPSIASHGLAAIRFDRVGYLPVARFPTLRFGAGLGSCVLVDTVVLLPPAAATRRVWRWQSDALAERFNVLTPDLPGHGGLPGPFTLERAVAEVSRQIDNVPGNVHLCGLSLSATVAVLTYLARPARVCSLVLSGGIAHPPPLLAIQRAVVAAMPERLILWLLRQQLSGTIRAMPSEARAEMIAGGVADFRTIGKRTYQDSLRELAHTDLRDRLPQITVPTLVLCGERDRANLPGARELAGGIVDAELRLIPNAGHFWNLEHPDLFTRTLADFVARAGGTLAGQPPPDARRC